MSTSELVEKYKESGVTGNALLKGFFWKQILDAGKDPVKYIQASERFSKLEYCVVTEESISFSADLQQPLNISSKYVIN